jgi:carbonic anhydrase
LREVNTAADPMFCFDKSLLSPVDLEGNLFPKQFVVKENFTFSYNTAISKISKHVFKMDGSFGIISLDNKQYKIRYTTFHSPSEHRIAGQRMPMEMQIMAETEAKEQLNVAILFKIVDQPNALMTLLGFGTGKLRGLDITSADKQDAHRIAELAVNLKPFLLNENSWLMYEGNELIVPCSKTTWLISTEPVGVVSQQMLEFDAEARPDFTIKSIGDRKIYRTTLKSNEKSQMQISNELEKEDKRMKDEMESHRKEEAQAKEAKKREQVHEQEVLRNKVNAYLKEKRQMQFKKPAQMGMEPLITEGLLKGVFKEVTDFNANHTPCKDFVRYSPGSSAKLFGAVPQGAVMPWEVKSLLDSSVDNKILRPDLPSPPNKDYILKPFYYVRKPVCHAENGQAKITKLSVLSDETQPKDFKTIEYVPVVVEALRSYHHPDYPVPTFQMSVPGATPEIQEVIIRRDFLAEKSPLLEKPSPEAEKNKATFGYIIRHNTPNQFPNLVTYSSPTSPAGNLIRVWPEILVRKDGEIPEDAVCAWNGLKEAEQVIFLQPPKSFDPNFRWIVFFYLPCEYEIGSENGRPFLPVYILARKDFVYKKDSIPKMIPVPLRAVKENGQIPSEELTLTFKKMDLKKLVPNPELLEAPKSVTPDKVFKRIGHFRELLFQDRAKQEAGYFQPVHDRYLKEKASKENAFTEEMEEITGVIVRPDFDYREKMEQMRAQEVENLRRNMNTLAELDQKHKKVISGLTKSKKLKKVCTKSILQIVVNDKSNFMDKYQEQRDENICLKWEWVEVPDPTASIEAPKLISTTNPEEILKKQEAREQELRDQALKDLEKFCLTKLHVVLNDPNMEYQDENHKVCRSVLDKLRKTDLKNFTRTMGPAFEELKAQAEKHAKKVEQAAAFIADHANQINSKVLGGLASGITESVNKIAPNLDLSKLDFKEAAKKAYREEMKKKGISNESKKSRNRQPNQSELKV